MANGAKPLIDLGYAQSRKFGVGPDFKVFTSAMTKAGTDLIAPEDIGKPILFMRGSSTIQDLQGDTMQITALQDMTRVDPNLTLFLNHSYDLPDDVYGKLYGPPKIEMAQGIADLWIGSEAVLSNPAAKKTYDLITVDGLRLGCSIGCQVTEYEFADEGDDEDFWFFGPIIIHHVEAVEWSIVGIPANQRCWVENAVKGLFARSLLEGESDKALELTPAFKSLYPKDFASAVEQITSPGLRKEMSKMRARGEAKQRIIYSFEKNEGFQLTDGKRAAKALTRDEAASLLVTLSAQARDDLRERKIAAEKEQESDGEKGLTEDEFLQRARAQLEKQVLDTETGESLVRQDLGEVEEEEENDVKEKELQIAADGTHDAYSGTHTHSHTAGGDQGDDGMHEHEHTHDNDANHGHSHSESNEAADDAGGEEEPKQDAAVDADTTKEAPHDLEKHALLSVYNHIGAQLGFPEHQLTTKCSLVENEGDAGIVKSVISALDDCSDGLLATALQVEGYVTQLQSMLGVPDDNGTMASLYALQNLVTKEGKELSARNIAKLQTIHDTIAEMHPDACKGVTGDGTAHQSGGSTVEEMQDEAALMGQGGAHMASLTASLESLAKAFDGFDLSAMTTETNTIRAALADAHTQLEATKAEQGRLIASMAVLKEMPLGRPTSLHRSIAPAHGHNVATYDDMLQAGGGGSEAPQETLRQALEQTIIEEVTTATGKQFFRKWPQGVGTDVRPPLTNNQKTMMLIWDIAAYKSGGEATVPMIDDPAEQLANA